jgi:hypothetical protein
MTGSFLGFHVMFHAGSYKRRSRCYFLRGHSTDQQRKICFSTWLDPVHFFVLEVLLGFHFDLQIGDQLRRQAEHHLKVTRLHRILRHLAEFELLVPSPSHSSFEMFARFPKMG